MTWDEEQEESLLQQVRQGDGAAMRAMYDYYAGFLTAVCSRYIINEDDLKDVLQDSFVKIFTSLDRFLYRGKGSLRAWMVRLVINEALSLLRQQERLNLVQTTWDLPDCTEEAEPDVEDVPPEVIHRLVRSLPTGYRTVLNLYVFEHKSHKEIAEMLHIKENSSASQLHRAKEMLAKGIMDYKKRRYG